MSEDKSYLINKSTLNVVLEALKNHMFSTIQDEDGWSDDYNNDDVIQAIDLLKKEIEKQDGR